MLYRAVIILLLLNILLNLLLNLLLLLLLIFIICSIFCPFISELRQLPLRVAVANSRPTNHMVLEFIVLILGEGRGEHGASHALVFFYLQILPLRHTFNIHPAFVLFHELLQILKLRINRHVSISRSTRDHSCNTSHGLRLHSLLHLLLWHPLIYLW